MLLSALSQVDEGEVGSSASLRKVSTMPNDNAITRLLYAILSQKCLKDIDWNKVAHNPILREEITNGHAARMRYSRFKKQIDGTANATSKPRTPRKSRIEKSKSSPSKKVKSQPKHGLDAGEDEHVKSEYHQRVLDNTPEAETEDSAFDDETYERGNGKGCEHGRSPIIKSEPRMNPMNTPLSLPMTPLYTGFGCMGREDDEPSPSPGTSFGHSHHNNSQMDDMDEMMASFGMPGSTIDSDGLFEPMGQGFGMGMGMGMNMHMGLGDPYEGLWHGPQRFCEEENESGNERDEKSIERVSVKTEPRWEEAYLRH